MLKFFNISEIQLDKGSSRPSWDAYFMEVASLIAERSTCPRLYVGAVIVRDNQILTTGYNGSLPGMSHCSDAGCYIVENHCLRTIHAEVNAVLQAAREGISLKGATLYCTHLPCINCMKVILKVGIEKILFKDVRDEKSYLSLVEHMKQLGYGEVKLCEPPYIIRPVIEILQIK
jgi:dCMP deaminase